LAICESLAMSSARPALASARIRSGRVAMMLVVLAKHDQQPRRPGRRVPPWGGNAQAGRALANVNGSRQTRGQSPLGERNSRRGHGQQAAHARPARPPTVRAIGTRGSTKPAPGACRRRSRGGQCADHGLASSTMLNGVSSARRKRVKPPSVTTSRNRASPAWAPSASPTSWSREAGVQTSVEAP
jgi:hypothetical protein